MTYAHPEYLVSTKWLADNLGDPNLRIFDTTVILKPGPDGQMTIESGLATYQAGHIPGAAFIDIAAELSDRTQKLGFMLPNADQFADVMGKAGVGPDTRVVVYSTSMPAWATRLWWMLRVFGFDNVALLDGGWTKWQAEGLATTTDFPLHPTAVFDAHFRPELVANKDDVLAAIGDGGTCIINALPAPAHSGEMAMYGRKGRIASSVNVPTAALDDPDTGTTRTAAELTQIFSDISVLDQDRIITYCGGGIAATHDAHALALIGREDVAVYDASMSEWASQPDTPMEIG
jgi:thiosulfate/3-mercaptopyruvate sulfurtransferase